MTPAPISEIDDKLLRHIDALKNQVTILRNAAQNIGAGEEVDMEMVAFLKYTAMRCGETLYIMDELLRRKVS